MQLTPQQERLIHETIDEALKHLPDGPPPILFITIQRDEATEDHLFQHKEVLEFATGSEDRLEFQRWDFEVRAFDLVNAQDPGTVLAEGVRP